MWGLEGFGILGIFREGPEAAASRNSSPKNGDFPGFSLKTGRMGKENWDGIGGKAGMTPQGRGKMEIKRRFGRKREIWDEFGGTGMVEGKLGCSQEM